MMDKAGLMEPTHQGGHGQERVELQVELANKQDYTASRRSIPSKVVNKELMLLSHTRFCYKLAVFKL